jgi:hypothetical protein
VRRDVVVCLLVGLSTPVSAWAQAAPPAAAQARVRPIDLVLGGAAAGPVGLGTTTVSFLRADGSPLTVFTAKNALGASAGVEIAVTVRPSTRWAYEATGSWMRGSARTTVSADVEGAPSSSPSAGLVRFGAGGAALWRFRQRGRIAWFMRAGLSWSRDLAGAATLVEDGVQLEAGVGLERPLRPGTVRGQRRLGLRVEARIAAARGGVAFGDAGLRVAPAGAVSLVIGLR